MPRKKAYRHRIKTGMTRKPEKVKEFIRVLEEALPCPANTSAAQRWEYLMYDGMYDGIKQAIGPMQSRTAPLKSTTSGLRTSPSK